MSPCVVIQGYYPVFQWARIRNKLSVTYLPSWATAVYKWWCIIVQILVFRFSPFQKLLFEPINLPIHISWKSVCSFYFISIYIIYCSLFVKFCNIDRIVSDNDSPQIRLMNPLCCNFLKASLDINRWYKEAKWPPFSRRHIQMHFLQWKIMNFD